MKVLITGVAGFTGRYLAASLARAGHEVFGLARTNRPVQNVSRIFVGNLQDRAWLCDVVNEVQPEWVVHLAAISFVAHGDTDEIYRTNILGTRHLLEALTSASTCRSVLLASSANVYGNSTEGVITEVSPPAPTNDYAVSKLAMEHLAALYADRLPIIVARPFNYTGVGQTEKFVIPKIVNHFKRKAPFVELGNLDVSRDFSDVRVVVDCYRRLLESNKAIGGTFNVCSGHAVSLGQILDIMRALSGHDIEVRVNPAFVRKNDVKVLLGSRERLESIIGKIHDIPIQQTLEWMLIENNLSMAT